ncbi:MAG: hypothetical protein ACE5H3_02605 [Planctomycetota bacterium]
MREHLLELLQGHDGKTVCDVAAEQHFFCRGFDRFPDHILRKRFPWLLHGEPGLSRAEILKRIRKWIHAREFVLGIPTACDLMAEEKDLCEGWDGFTDEKIAASFEEMFGERVAIVPEERT